MPVRVSSGSMRTDPQKVVVKQLKMPWTIAVTNGDLVRHGSRRSGSMATLTSKKFCHLRLDEGVCSAGYGSS